MQDHDQIKVVVGQGSSHVSTWIVRSRGRSVLLLDRTVHAGVARTASHRRSGCRICLDVVIRKVAFT